MGRKKHPEPLTPAEQRVLEEVRTGATNAEIAVRLGLSINTVKYHVANMLSKLEAEDRRELAAWSGEGGRSWRRLGLWVGVGAVALATVFVVMVLLIDSHKDEPAREIRVVEWLAPGDGVSNPDGRWLSITEVISGSSFEIGKANEGSLLRPSWSPDGERLVAWEFESDANYLRVWDAHGNEISKTKSLGRTLRFSWAPDSSAFIPIGLPPLLVFDRDGAQLAEVAAPNDPRPGSSSTGPSVPRWSPDSNYYALVWNGSLVVGGATMDARAVPLSDLGFGIAPDRIFPPEWVSPTKLEFVAYTAAGEHPSFTVDVTSSPFTAVPGDAKPGDFGIAPPPYDQDMMRIRTAHPERELVLSRSTADGRGAYFVLNDTDYRPGRPNSILIVSVDGIDYETELSTKNSTWGLDVVLVGDWRGN